MSEDERKKSKLRELYAYRSKLTEKLDELTKVKTKVDSEIDEVNKKLAGVLKGIESIEGRGLLITTHAIIRYRERINPDATEEMIRAHLLTPQLINMVNTLGNGEYPVEDFKVIVEDNKVVTIIPVDHTPKPKPHQRNVIIPRRRKPRKH
jgi:hypothetical protein